MKRYLCLAGLVSTLLLLVLTAGCVRTQPPPPVRAFPSLGPDPDHYKIVNQVQALRLLKIPLDIPGVEAQLNRTSCTLKLPPSRRHPLTGRQLWSVAQASHLRVGWYHLCKKCGKWHLNLAGGYALTSDGVVATCDHIVRPDKAAMRQGYLVAASDDGTVYPVMEIMATSRAADTAIIRIMANDLVPLPLSTNVVPGDSAWCYSAPMTRRGYFSHGIVNRFVRKGPGKPLFFNVGTDWAPGSSGSAVLDSFGNAIGQVSSIESIAGHEGEAEKGGVDVTQIIIHEATTSRELLKLIGP